MENNQQFWQFSDQLRVHTNNLSNLSLNDSIWSNSFASKRTEGRRNFDIRVGGELNSVNSSNSSKAKESDFNGFNNGWKIGGSDFNGFNVDWKSGSGLGSIGDTTPNVGINGGFSKGVYSKPSVDYNLESAANLGFGKGIYSKPSVDYNLDNNRNLNLNVNLNLKGNYKKGEDIHHNYSNHGAKNGKRNKNNSNKDSEGNKDNKNSVEKRFKTLPPSESLPRNETIGGYIFVCNNDTMNENLKRELFGLPPRYRDSVRAITPGLPLFLYNYSTHQLHGVYEAASFGGTNIDPTAWEDKKNPGESRFPAQVRVMTRKVCEPLEEDSFRPILHHYDGPKFRLELNIPEALSLLDVFSENNA